MARKLLQVKCTSWAQVMLHEARSSGKSINYCSKDKTGCSELNTAAVPDAMLNTPVSIQYMQCLGFRLTYYR